MTMGPIQGIAGVAFQCSFLYLSLMVQSPSTSCLTLNPLHQICKSIVSTREEVIEDVREVAGAAKATAAVVIAADVSPRT